MNFQQAEQQFQLLEAAYVAGQMDLERYRSELAALQVIDAAGTAWQMQERTGVWYYYWQGQWIARSPYPNPMNYPHIPVSNWSPPQPLAQHPSSRPNRIPLVIGLVLAAIVIGIGLFFLFTEFLNQPGVPGSTSSSPGSAVSAPQSSAQTNLNLEKLSEANVAANGSPVTDDNGVLVQVPPEALNADAAEALVTTFRMQGQLADAISHIFTIDTPLYTLEAAGQQDSMARATLVFPARSPQSRLLEIIDDQYILMVETQPIDGKLTFYPRLGPADTQGLQQVGSLHFDGSRRFVVVTPKKTTQSEFLPVSVHPQTVGGVDCTTADEFGLYPCRANEKKTIRVSYSSKLGLTALQAYQMAKEAEKWMDKYFKLGFKNADLSSYWFAMNIIIQSGSGDPSYSSKSSNIYIPLDYVKKIGSGEGSKALGHELAHWIEDEAFAMCWAGLKSYKYSSNFWWLEVAAENMVMLADDTYIQGNIQTYGTITTANEALVWQMSPKQWPADFYAQAQLVKVFMCESSTCVTSEKTFKEAITKGTYPFETNEASQKLMAGIEDYARYLVGAAPQKTNTAISLSGVASGETFGEVISVSQKKGVSLLNYIGNRKPQVVKAVANEIKDGLESLTFTAPLEQYGVYPLTITSKKGYAGLPTMLVVEAGTPLVYRLDNGEVQQHSGEKDLILGPISAELGYSEVRLAAYNTVPGGMFRAHLEVVDLKGAWVLQVSSTNPTTSTVTCDNPPKNGDTDDLYKLFPIYGNFSIAFGDFSATNDPTRLQWAIISKRLPASVDPKAFTANYLVEMTPQEIMITGNLDSPKKKSELPGTGQFAGLTGLTFATMGMVGAVRAKRCPKTLRRWLAAVGLLAFLVILLSGCLGFYGSTQAEIKITKFERASGDTAASINLTTVKLPSEKPIWAITKATGVYSINTTTESTPPGDKAKTTFNRCIGDLTFDLAGGIYPDISIQADSK